MAEGIKRTRDRWRIRGETREDDLIYNYEESKAKKKPVWDLEYYLPDWSDERLYRDLGYRGDDLE